MALVEAASRCFDFEQSKVARMEAKRNAGSSFTTRLHRATKTCITLRFMLAISLELPECGCSSVG